MLFRSPVQTPGSFYAGEGPVGPLAAPGDYQVRLTANGKSETATLHLAIDPRIKESAPGIQKSFELAMQVNKRVSQLHTAINEIRDTRAQLQALRKRFGSNERLQPALGAADEMEKKMTPVEEKLIQVNMKASEANLVFPNQLNEEFDTFSHVIEADSAPTQSQLEVFAVMSGRLDEQLKTWAQIKTDEVAKINDLIKQADLPALTVAGAAEPTPSPSPAPPATVPGPSPAESATPASSASPAPSSSPASN